MGIFICSIVGAVAQEQEIVDDYLLWGICDKFILNNQTQMLAWGAEVAPKNFTIYNSDFEAIKTISKPSQEILYLTNKREVLENGNWVLSYDNSYERKYTNYMEFEAYDFKDNYETNIIITQTLFNKDASYEYIAPLYEIRDNVTRTDTEKSLSQYVIISGFKVMSEEGNELQTIKFIDGFYTRDTEHDLYTTGEKSQLIFHGYTSDGEWGELIYTIENKTSKISTPRLVKGAKVSPTSVRQSDIIDVTLESPATNRVKINIVDASSGRIEDSCFVNAGDISTTIDTSRLGRGVHIVTVDDGENIREHTKIIIR